jgi:hypothetical protein
MYFMDAMIAIASNFFHSNILALLSTTSCCCCCRIIPVCIIGIVGETALFSTRGV